MLQLIDIDDKVIYLEAYSCEAGAVNVRNVRAYIEWINEKGFDTLL